MRKCLSIGVSIALAAAVCVLPIAPAAAAEAVIETQGLIAYATDTLQLVLTAIASVIVAWVGHAAKKWLGVQIDDSTRKYVTQAVDVAVNMLMTEVRKRGGNVRDIQARASRHWAGISGADDRRQDSGAADAKRLIAMIAAILKQVGGAFLNALLTKIVEAYNARRRDKALEKLGYDKRALEQYEADLAAQRSMLAADERPAADRLHDGTF
jgi:hypothetical protein